MRNLQTNQLFAALLLALLLERLTALLGSSLVAPSSSGSSSYVVEGVSVSSQARAPQAPPEPLPLSPLLKAASPEKGRQVARKCLQCHGFDKDGFSKIGPNLHGIYGATIASNPTFPYSKAMKAKEGVWDTETLNLFLYKPRDFVRGTKMVFAGLEKAQDRADLVAYLKSLRDG